jgi:glycerol uptake facilitator-like aquaporin
MNANGCKWMNKYAAEMFGTFALVLIGVGSAVLAGRWLEISV